MPEHTSVQPPLRYVAPRFRRRLFRFLTLIYPLYLRYGLNIRRIEVEGIESLIEHYRLFQEKRIRLMIVFRHPHVDDGALMAWLLGGEVRKRGRRNLGHAPFAQFVYDRGAPLWAGAFIGWLLPRMGAIPIFRGKLDSHGLKEIRTSLVNGDQPLAIAPEGAVSYNERSAAPLERGVAHFAFWCVGDLLAASRTEEVIVLPVAPSYHHGRDSHRMLRRIVSFLERECGLAHEAGESIHERLRNAADALFQTSEHFYRRFYATSSSDPNERSLPPPKKGANGAHATAFRTADPSRVEALLEAALVAAEARLGLESNGEPIPRIRRIEQACWDRIYREDIDKIADLSPLDRALADRTALETSITMRHLQLADIMVYLRDLAIPDDANPDMLAEAASNLAGIVARLKGGDVSATPRMGSRSVTFRVGISISASRLWEAYRRAPRQAVDGLMTSLRGEFQRLSGIETEQLRTRYRG